METNQCTGNTYPDPVSGKCISCSAVDEDGIEGCATCEYDSAKGKPKCLTCSKSGGDKIPRTTLDGTSTCILKSTCTQSGAAGEDFLSDGDTECIVCGNDSSATENNKGTPGCKTCTKNSAKPTCSACLDGYYDSGNGSPATCVACGVNCATCSKDDPNKCSTCKSGYFKQSDSPGTCTSCDDADSGIPGCATCSFSGSLTCSSCKPNYKQSGSDPVTCTRACEDETACGAIVVGGDGSMTYYCSQCRQQ